MTTSSSGGMLVKGLTRFDKLWHVCTWSWVIPPQTSHRGCCRGFDVKCAKLYGHQGHNSSSLVIIIRRVMAATTQA